MTSPLESSLPQAGELRLSLFYFRNVLVSRVAAALPTITTSRIAGWTRIVCRTSARSGIRWTGAGAAVFGRTGRKAHVTRVGGRRSLRLWIAHHLIQQPVLRREAARSVIRLRGALFTKPLLEPASYQNPDAKNREKDYAPDERVHGTVTLQHEPAQKHQTFFRILLYPDPVRKLPRSVRTS